MRACSAKSCIMYSYIHIQNFAPEMPQIIDVFYDSFAASEGIDEGDLIQSIVKNLLGNTANSDLFVFGAIHNTSIIGCAIFSRLTYLHDPRNVFILSPMAIHPNHQNNGIGQNLLLESIGFLKTRDRHSYDLWRSRILRESRIFTCSGTRGTSAIPT